MCIPKGGIAFFDSGIGGMTVLAECEKRFKNEIFYYYGDNLHAPYGNLPIYKIKKYVHRAFALFQSLEVKAVVIACNTVTAICIDELRQKYSFPIIGVEPALMKALKLLKNNNRNEEKTIEGTDGDSSLLESEPKGSCIKEEQNRDLIYVLMTRATYNSERFHLLYDKVRKKYPNQNVEIFACDNLAGAIEKNIGNADFRYEDFLPKGNPSVVVLGCTHYIYIKEQIEQHYCCSCVDGNEGVAERLISVLNYSARNAYDKQKKIMKYRKKDEKNSKTEKNRNSEPIVTTFVPNLKMDKKRGQKTLKRNTNKCSHFLRKCSNPLITKRGQNIVYFCGSGKRYNALFYKQMFVFCSDGVKNGI